MRLNYLLHLRLYYLIIICYNYKEYTFWIKTNKIGVSIELMEDQSSMDDGGAWLNPSRVIEKNICPFLFLPVV